MSYFFRGVEDGYKFKLFGNVHIALILVWLIGMAMIVIFKKQISERFKNDLFLKFLIGILLLDQIILYSWQLGSGFFNLNISLPLYHCRVAVWFLIIGVFFDVKWLRNVGMYWSILGTILAMFIPDLYKFSYPHYTNFQFFIVHILLGYVVIYLITIKKYDFNTKDLKKVLIIANVFNILVILFNLMMLPKYPLVNYGYLLNVPLVLKNVINVSTSIYILVIFILYNVITLVVWLIGRLLYRTIGRD